MQGEETWGRWSDRLVGLARLDREPTSACTTTQALGVPQPFAPAPPPTYPPGPHCPIPRARHTPTSLTTLPSQPELSLAGSPQLNSLGARLT
ncbi:hypothetical protein ES705_35259 [subsurface metagenome]